MIPFNNIPANWKLPLWWAEVDPSRAGTHVIDMPALLPGIRKAGVAADNAIVAVSSVDQANSLWGQGSMVARMVAAFMAGNPTQKLYAAGVPEPSAGVASTGSITVTTAPTSAGTLNLYIAGQRVQVGVAATDTAANVATKIGAAIASAPDLPVTANVAGSVVSLTAKWKGASGNDIIVGDTYRGAMGQESLPVGLSLTYVAMGSGTGSPDLTALVSNMGDQDYKFVALPFSDTASLDLFAAEYGFGDTGRWGFLRQLYGAVYVAIRDTYSNLMIAGPTRNDAVISRMAIEPLTQSPVWEVAAAYAAQAAKGMTNDPARPLQTLAMPGIVTAPRDKRFAKTQRNTLTGVGLAVQSVNPNGQMMIERETTSYQKNAYGIADNAFDVIPTLYTLSTLFERQRAAITSKFPRHKLANDGTRFGAGSAIVTPKIIKGELVAQYAEDEALGLVENARAFAKNLIVERDADDPNRLNVLYPPDLVNQLRVFAVLAQFRLQYQTA